MSALKPRAAQGAERLAALFFPRRCPLCGALLGADAVLSAVCPDCADEERRLRHTPPRLPPTEHSFSALDSAAGAYYYAGGIRHAILLCKEYGNPWFARELTDLALVHVFGALPAAAPGQRPQLTLPPGLALYDAIVPVPPRAGDVRTSLPDLIARRLSAVLGVPQLRPLGTTRTLTAQKTLDRENRLRNVRGAYSARPGTDLTGRRVLLVDDIITTGATVSSCALALLQAGANTVTALCLAADEELPKDRQKPQENKHP